MLKYKKIENSLLHTIVHLASKRRILMRKTKEKQRNITNQGKAAADIKETDDRKQADFKRIHNFYRQFLEKNQRMINMAFWMSE